MKTKSAVIFLMAFLPFMSIAQVTCPGSEVMCNTGVIVNVTSNDGRGSCVANADADCDAFASESASCIDTYAPSVGPSCPWRPVSSLSSCVAEAFAIAIAEVIVSINCTEGAEGCATAFAEADAVACTFVNSFGIEQFERAPQYVRSDCSASAGAMFQIIARATADAQAEVCSNGGGPIDEYITAVRASTQCEIAEIVADCWTECNGVVPQEALDDLNCNAIAAADAAANSSGDDDDTKSGGYGK